MEDDDDQSTCVEPVISYCSPSATRGVKEKSNNKFNSFRSNYNDFSSHHTSVNNTIMLPFISSDGSKTVQEIRQLVLKVITSKRIMKV